MNNPEYNQLMTTSEVARMLNLHVNTVRRWSALGILKSYRVGPRYDRRFKREDIVIFLAEQYEYGNSENKKDGLTTS